MAANGRGIMRPGGKSPPFLAIGLVVTILILGFNYWSLSAKNAEQANEIALIESELRLVNAKKVSAEKRSDAISDKVKDLEEEIKKQKEKGKSDIATLELAKAGKEKEIEDFKAQLATATTQKETCEKELQNKKIELENEQKKVKTCSESDCQQFVTETRQKVLKEVHEVAGAQPLVSMLEKNMDLGDMRESVISMKTVMEQGGNDKLNAPKADQPVLKEPLPLVNHPAGKGEPMKSPAPGVAPVNHDSANQGGPQIPNANDQQGHPNPVGPSKLEGEKDVQTTTASHITVHPKDTTVPVIQKNSPPKRNTLPKIKDDKVDLEENEDPDIKEGNINHVAHDDDEYDDADDADKAELRYEQKEENNDVLKDDKAVDVMAQIK